jgi:hypothetical protein
VLLATYTLGDSYATVIGGSNVLAQIARSSGDFTLGDQAGGIRTLTSASGQDAEANATAASGANRHFAFLDTATSRVLWVTPESTGQAITAGNPVTFPALTYRALQPVAPA